MIRYTTKKTICILLLLANTCFATSCAKSLTTSKPQVTETDPVTEILGQLSEKTSQLQSYQANIEYLFHQPLFESKTLRKGILYYQKLENKSYLRINFQTLKQDEEEEQKYIEDYIFDSIWLSHFDYQIKQAKLYEMAEVNEPVDAFDLVSRNFPIIGFSKTEDLRNQFDIKLVEQQQQTENLIQLHLKVKPTSTYKDDYTSIDFWIDKNLNLPAKIIATSTEEDIYQIKLVEPKINEHIDKKIFNVEIPKDFGEPEITRLKKARNQKK